MRETWLRSPVTQNPEFKNPGHKRTRSDASLTLTIRNEFDGCLSLEQSPLAFNVD